MNESFIALAAIIIPAIGGLIMFLLNTIDKRIDNVKVSHGSRIAELETSHEKIQEEKLSKQDYYRDQGIQRAILSDMQEDLKALPDRLLNTLKLIGKL